MANEKKTERIVYSHFEKSNDIIHIEEQASDIPKIDKSLKSASKKGTGKGRPEFLITYNKNADLLIVIECKAEVTKHESPNRDKFADFAVDGVLLYASYLSKDFDVLAIAVSGETKQQLKVSHFLHLKNERKATEIFGDKLLSAQDYLDGYLKSPEKFRQDYNTLLEFTKKLNEKLHTYKILESQRSLLISCILIALEDDAFKTSYTKKTTPKSLADFLTKTVSEKLEEANISGKKLENLNIQFGFIKTDTSLSTKDKVLKELIDEIDENINQFIKTHEYFDVLGQLYIEFLRYANSDKGLGIVLTPPHITELFAELAQVNKNSIAFDNCTGTGGFLISAMKKMIEDAKGDKEKEAEIKSNQLIGVEYQAHIFALAVSNMYIHQDGKTNIINGSCFEDDIIKEVKAKKPTVGFLNPPYKGDKNDIEELDFILNNLDCLVDGGKCVAIVPLERAVSTSGKTFELKRKLLEKHTLDAVLSMPDELFFNSKVGVVSCIMIFTAHKPHDKDVETYFGYYKNDGFEKRKNLGRIDANGSWNELSSKWINYFKRKKEEAGFSVNKFVSAEMEWCPELYMETGYQLLTNENFEKKLIDYNTFLYFNKIKSEVSSKKLIENTTLKLNITNWAYFNVSDLFEVTATKDELPSKLSKGTFTPYITSSEMNNGITSFVDEISDFGANTITANRGGSVGYFFYQPVNYLATPVDVRVLTAKFNLNQYIGLFLVTIFELEKFRFNYSRKMGTDRLKQMTIKLPSKNGKPDFDFMENYIKSLNYSYSI
jgi:type I restriction enzyme M protein